MDNKASFPMKSSLSSLTVKLSPASIGVISSPSHFHKEAFQLSLKVSLAPSPQGIRPKLSLLFSIAFFET